MSSDTSGLTAEQSERLEILREGGRELHDGRDAELDALVEAGAVEREPHKTKPNLFFYRARP